MVSVIQKEGLKMCIDMKISKQASKDKQTAKYEMGNFCEQYGLPSVAHQEDIKVKKLTTVKRGYNILLIVTKKSYKRSFVLVFFMNLDLPNSTLHVKFGKKKKIIVTGSFC
jgi:hypothetical protein